MFVFRLFLLRHHSGQSAGLEFSVGGCGSRHQSIPQLAVREVVSCCVVVTQQPRALSSPTHRDMATDSLDSWLPQ